MSHNKYPCTLMKKRLCPSFVTTSKSDVIHQILYFTVVFCFSYTFSRFHVIMYILFLFHSFFLLLCSYFFLFFWTRDNFCDLSPRAFQVVARVLCAKLTQFTHRPTIKESEMTKWLLDRLFLQCFCLSFFAAVCFFVVVARFRIVPSLFVWLPFFFFFKL